jgi:hypothetical protein
VVFSRAGKRTIALPLTSSGFRALRSCATVRMAVQTRARRRAGGAVKVRKTSTTYPRVRFGCRGGLIVTGLGSGSGVGVGNHPGHGGTGGGYSVGVAERSINPTAAEIATGKVYLGGFGIASPPLQTGRPASGILGDGLHVRALAVSAGTRAAAFADIEVQGWFVANRDGPYGLVDMRKAVQARTGGALKATDVMIQSDHTHGGPDPMGVWGGVPVAYRQFMFNQTVDAIVEAYQRRRPGSLYYGTTPARDLLSNQFDYDAANQVMDSDVRVLQARDDNGQPFATLLNFSAHATVLGSSNTHVTGDWVQAANPLLVQRFGGQAMTMVGTLGRTQPADRGCHNKALSGDAQSLCSLDEYAGRVVDRAVTAADVATPLSGPPTVDSRSYLIEDVGSNPLLIGLLYVGTAGGTATGVPLNRANTPPWFTGTVIGTVTASFRIGDVLLSVIPGEAYPQIALNVSGLATAPRGFMTAGLAGDQLGYLIAPYTAYPEPIKSTFVDRGDMISPVDNDNYAFNVSHTMGERVNCSLLRGAGEVFGKGTSYRDADVNCAPFLNDLLLPAGADTG